MVGFSHFCVVGVSPFPSSINTKSLQPPVALYFSIVPFGTYSVALTNVLYVKILSSDALPSIVNGFSIREMTVGISTPLNAPPPMYVTPLPMVMEVRPEQL